MWGPFSESTESWGYIRHYREIKTFPQSKNIANVERRQNEFQSMPQDCYHPDLMKKVSNFCPHSLRERKLFLFLSNL